MSGRDVPSQLSASRNVAELRGIVDSLCADFGQVLNVTLVCEKGQPEKKRCVIDLIPNHTDIQACANRLGGQVFGYSSVIVDITPHPDFHCPRNQQSDAPGCACVPKA